MRNKGLGLAIIVGVLVMCGWLAYSLVPKPPRQNAPLFYPKATARACVRNYMERVLKDPDSAKYTDWTVNSIAKTDTSVSRAGTGDYRVRVLVNAKNSFGGYTGSRRYVFNVAVYSDGGCYVVIDTIDVQ